VGLNIHDYNILHSNQQSITYIFINLQIPCAAEYSLALENMSANSHLFFKSQKYNYEIFCICTGQMMALYALVNSVKYCFSFLTGDDEISFWDTVYSSATL